MPWRQPESSWGCEQAPGSPRNTAEHLKVHIQRTSSSSTVASLCKESWETLLHTKQVENSDYQWPLVLDLFFILLAQLYGQLTYGLYKSADNGRNRQNDWVLATAVWDVGLLATAVEGCRRINQLLVVSDVRLLAAAVHGCRQRRYISLDPLKNTILANDGSLCVHTLASNRASWQWQRAPGSPGTWIQHSSWKRTMEHAGNKRSFKTWLHNKSWENLDCARSLKLIFILLAHCVPAGSTQILQNLSCQLLSIRLMLAFRAPHSKQHTTTHLLWRNPCQIWHTFCHLWHISTHDKQSAKTHCASILF